MICNSIQLGCSKSSPLLLKVSANALHLRRCTVSASINERIEKIINTLKFCPKLYSRLDLKLLNLPSTYKKIEGILDKGLSDNLTMTACLKQLQSNKSALTVRAMLPVLAYAALGGTKSEDVLPIGLSLALLHEALLIFDDIQDRDELRRNQPTIWVEHGIPQAINIGFFILIRALDAILSVEMEPQLAKQISQRYMHSIQNILYGQALDVQMSGIRPPSLDLYIKSAQSKNGTALSMSVELPALVHGLDLQTAIQVAKPFELIGVLHQMANDLADLKSKGGRPPGQDLYEGKSSIVAITYLENAKEDSERFLSFIRAPRQQKTQDLINMEIAKIINMGIPEKIVIAGEQQYLKVQNESNSIANFPELKQMLGYLADRKIAKIRKHANDLRE